jgi:hypothetical protein
MLFRPILIAVLWLCTSGVALQAVASDAHRFEGSLDTAFYISDSDFNSWLRRGVGKLRYDERHDGLRVNRAFIDYTGRLSPTWSGNVLLNANNDVAEKVDVLEAYLEWRPVPRSAWRFRGRIGAFYPRFSVENTAAGWSSPYALSSSVINSWIGEELRTIGVEARLVNDLPGVKDQQLVLEAAVFGFNDPTGATLTWHGWAAHDRQTGIFGSVPMPTVSAIEPWAPGGQPLPKSKPFKEIDNRPGFYVGAQWRLARKLLIKAHHYDNHADPEATSGADYAWRTWFDHVGLQASLPWKVGLLGQWLSGSTQMGPDLGPWHVQDVDFDASYMLLTRAFGKHRLSMRYEWFDLQPFNDPAAITNQDKGNVAAVAWLYQFQKDWRVGAEFLQIRSTHCRTDTCFWRFNGLPRKTNESQLQISLRWSFGDSRE